MGKSLEFSFGIIAPQTRKAASRERLGPVARDILDFISSQVRPDQFEVWLNQTWFAMAHSYSRSAVNRAMGTLRKKGFVTPVGLIQYNGRGRYTLVYDVTLTREEFEVGGYGQNPAKQIKNWSKEKVFKRTKGGRYVPFKVEENKSKPQQPNAWKRATGLRQRASNGQFISSLGKQEPAFPVDLSDFNQKLGVLGQPHPGCALAATHPIVSLDLNTPPTPSVDSNSNSPKPTCEELEGEGFDVLWNALRQHSDFSNWARNSYFEKTLRPFLDEKGFEEGFDLLLNALTGAANDNWWGGRDGKAKDFVHNWKRWLPAVVKSSHFERFVEEGSLILEQKARRNKLLKEQKEKERKEEALLRESKADVEESIQFFRNELKKNGVIKTKHSGNADQTKRKRRSALNKKHHSQMPADKVKEAKEYLTPFAEAKAALAKMRKKETQNAASEVLKNSLKPQNDPNWPARPPQPSKTEAQRTNIHLNTAEGSLDASSLESSSGAQSRAFVLD